CQPQAAAAGRALAALRAIIRSANVRAVAPAPRCDAISDLIHSVGIHPKMIEDLNPLKVFLAVSTCGNMTAAAKRLGLTQSAVSQSIRQLEDNLGSVLLDRAQRPLRLTAAGMVLQRHAVPLVEDAATLATVVRQAGASKVHELRIGIIDSFASTVGPSLIRSLLSQAERL